MGHHISKSVSHGSISSRAKSTKNQKKPITTVCTTPTHSSAVIDNLDSTNQQQHLPFTDETTASESHANIRAGVFNFITDSPQNIRSQTKTIKSLGATPRITNEKSKVVGSQQIVIKIQLAKMESGEVNDDSVPDCGVNQSNNNLNVECSVLNLSFPQNILCESSSFAPNKKILMSSIMENRDLDSNTEIKLNNLNITEDSNTRLSINSESTTSISKSVPFIDDDGNDLDDASHRVFAKGTTGQNFNITLQPVSKFEIPIHLPPGSCIVNRSGTRVEKLPKVEDKSMIEYSDVADINEKVIDEDSVGADGDDGLEDKSVSFKRKAKTSSTYPSLSKCGDAIKQFLNSSKSSKKQEKERKPPPTSTSLINSNSRSSQLSYASDNETDSFSDSTAAAAMARETMVVTPTKIVNNLAVTPLCNVGDHLALWSPPSSEQLSLWTPATSEMMIPIAAAQQFVVVQYPNAVLRFSPNGSSVLDNTVAAAASVRMVATEFEIIGGTSSDSRPITRLSDGSSLTPVIHSSSITREKNASSGGPIFHSQVDYIHCLVPDLDKITKSSFYWGKIDRYEAERLLEGMPEGTFLLRDSAQEEYLFSVTFRKYGRSLHARIEQLNHKFSFDCHDPGVFTASTVTGLLEHYKDPSCVMFFEPMLTIPLHRTAAFSLQQLCRATIVSRTTYDGVSELELPSRIKAYLKEYHYKQRVRVKPLDESFYTMRS